jgi:hypothetical protein
MIEEKNYLSVGTRLSGYAGPKLGPFKCANCIHFDAGPPSHCEHPIVVSDWDVPHAKGKALVDANACCTYYRNK